jgi:hypothetical protein
MEQQNKKSGLLKKAGLFASTLGAVVVGTSANAAPITFDTADLLANIGAGEGFVNKKRLLLPCESYERGGEQAFFGVKYGRSFNF